VNLSFGNLGLRSHQAAVHLDERWPKQPAGNAPIAPNLHISDRKPLRAIRGLQMQTQGINGSIQLIDFPESPTINGLLKLAEEMLHLSKCTPRNELSEEELVLATFQNQLPNLPLASIKQLKACFPLPCHD
jgi:hypothetical protein